MTEKQKSTKKPGEAAQQSQAIANIQKTIADSVLLRVQTFVANKDIRLPPGYVAENAVKSAWLILLETKDKNQAPVLQVCTRDSIANALFNMVIQGLNPVKKQCDFIAYGDKLLMQREYHGTLALAKRYGGILEVVGTVIYEGDEFGYSIDERGYKKVVKHIQELDNVDVNKIKGAYATVLFEDKERAPYVEVMTMAQIRQSWQQGATKGASPAHKNFPDQMAIKTVISRACKLFISSSDDSALFEEGEEVDHVSIAREKIQKHANKEEITIDTIATEVKNGEDNKPAEEKQGENRDPEPAEVIPDETGSEKKGSEKLPGF